ncbi:MAG: hypothetical protein WA621_18535 [Candidatus Acidiferrum sp.]
MKPHTQDTLSLEPNASPAHNTTQGRQRCRARRRDLKQCRLYAQDPATSLCARHATYGETSRYELQDSTDLSKEILIVDNGSYGTTENINSLLSNVVELIAKGRISPRRAAVITYALSLMLRSIIVSDHKAANAHSQIIFDDPCARSDEDQPTAKPQEQNNATVADPYSRPHT